MSERSLAILPSLAPLARRLSGRRAVVLVATAGGLVAVALRALWLAPSSGPLNKVAVEVALPPPAGLEPQDAGTPASAPSAGVDPATIRPGAGNVVTVSPVSIDAFARTPLAPRAAPLPPAPDPALVEAAGEGPLPRRSADGRLPWHAYARTFPAGDGRARIAVIVTGLGSSAVVTREIIRRLPADVTFAFEPAAANVLNWGREARAAGHEIMLSLPVQGVPFLDRGPEALAGDVAATENRARLHRLLVRLAGYVGALANIGAEANASTDAAAAGAMELAGRELTERGLVLVTPFADKTKAGDVPQLGVDLTIGPDADVATARARLAELEERALAKGYAVAVVEPTPSAAEALAAWAGTLAGKPVVLAPVSAVAQAVQSHGR